MDDSKFPNPLIVYDEIRGTIIGIKALTEEQASGGLKLPFKSMEAFHSADFAALLPIRPDRHGYYLFRELLTDYNSSAQDDGRTFLVVLQWASKLKAPENVAGPLESVDELEHGRRDLAQLADLKVGDRTVHVWGVVPHQLSDIYVVGKHWVVSDDDQILGGITAKDGETYGSVEREVLLLLEAINKPKES